MCAQRKPQKGTFHLTFPAAAEEESLWVSFPFPRHSWGMHRRAWLFQMTLFSTGRCQAPKLMNGKEPGVCSTPSRTQHGGVSFSGTCSLQSFRQKNPTTCSLCKPEGSGLLFQLSPTVSASVAQRCCISTGSQKSCEMQELAD